MAKSLVVMCCECKKIKIGDNLWIGEEHPSYSVLSKRPRISDGYCQPCTEMYQEKIKERRIINALEK